jgi:molybdopterin-guanine dinucleotide biosynthesis protein A
MIHALIIAGGQGRRLGGIRKADIRIGGVRLIERVLVRLQSAEPPILVSTGPAGTDWLLPSGCEAVSDLPGSGGGPLAGVVAAVAALRNRGIASGVLVSAAVDTPFLPEDYLSRLIGGLRHAPAAFGGWGTAFYPTNAAWRIEAIADLPERLDDLHSLKALQAELGAQRVGWDECPEDPFANVNTPEDLAALEERAKRDAGL